MYFYEQFSFWNYMSKVIYFSSFELEANLKWLILHKYMYMNQDNNHATYKDKIVHNDKNYLNGVTLLDRKFLRVPPPSQFPIAFLYASYTSFTSYMSTWGTHHAHAVKTLCN